MFPNAVISPWKTPEGRAKYMAAYDATLALWPVPYEELDVPTRFGTTHIIASGPREAPPLVLLHAMEFSATMWFPNVGELSRHFRVYAVDTMSEIGKSVPSHPLRSRAECSEWVVEVFDALHLGQADVVGESRGGWLALNVALSAPERVKRLVLLNPSAFVPMSGAFFLGAFPAVLWPIHPLLHRALYAWFVKGFVINERFAEQFMLGLRHFTLPKLPPLPTVFSEAELHQRVFHFLSVKTATAFPTLFSDDQLRRLTTPTLLLLGKQDTAMNEQAAFDRAKRLIPQLEVEMFPKAGHILSMEQPQVVNARILKFLGQGQEPEAASKLLITILE